MTARGAERITGLVVKSIDGKPGWFGIFQSEDAPLPLHAEKASKPSAAIQKLVDWNWKRVQAIVFTRAAWRCEGCRRFRPLSCHHVIFRSHGRNDRPSNILALCSDCHNRKHGGR